jgi:hypothetical protein
MRVIQQENVMRSVFALPLIVLAAGCAKPEASGGPVAASRDSAGVAIVEYPGTAWDQAPEWRLSAAPLTTIGGAEDDSIDLTLSYLGTMLPDGRIVIATAEPSDISLFAADGRKIRSIGRAGQGPGEYQTIANMQLLGTDSLLAYEWTRHLGLVYSTAGDFLEQEDFPASSGFPSVMRGRLDNGTYVFAIENYRDSASMTEARMFRQKMPVLTARPGDKVFDTLLTTLGTQMTPQTLTVMGRTVPTPQPVAYGPTTQIVTGGNTTYISTGEQFQVTAYDSTGAARRIIRLVNPPRAVTEADREKYKARLREVLDRQMKSLQLPPNFPRSEVDKIFEQGKRIIDSTVFAETLPAISQMMVESNGTLWVSLGATQTDVTRRWLVFSPDGQLLGKVTTPGLAMFAVQGDRVVVRQEDEETGLVRLEVWGLNRPALGEAESGSLPEGS